MTGWYSMVKPTAEDDGERGEREAGVADDSLDAHVVVSSVSR